MGKQMEGDNEQRRSRSAEAREAGRRPSEDGVTTGASGQSRSLGNQASHEEKMAGPGWGKQQPDRVAPDPKPGSVPSRREATTAQEDKMPPRAEMPRAEPGELSEHDQRVFESVATLEGDSAAPTASEIARATGLARDEAISALQRLMNDHDIVRERPAEDEFGPRYEVKGRL